MIINIETHDRVILKGRLSLPDNEELLLSKLVIAIDGAGPWTYDSNFRIPASFFTDCF